jgi:DNA-binding NarL/FixJ family response regulator
MSGISRRSGIACTRIANVAARWRFNIAWGIIMADQDMPELPFTPDKWQRLIHALRLPPQQLRVVELILRNKCDKQIADAMGLKKPTVRTYMQRIFARMGVCDRVELVLKLCALSHGIGHLEE